MATAEEAIRDHERRIGALEGKIDRILWLEWTVVVGLVVNLALYLLHH